MDGPDPVDKFMDNLLRTFTELVRGDLTLLSGVINTLVDGL